MIVTLLLFAALWPVLPSNRLTPGRIESTSRDQVCVAGFAALRRKTSVALKAEIYREYGISHYRPGDFEIDHRVPLSLGGADVRENLWPQSYNSALGAHEKDALEDRIHVLVCHEMSMSLADGQRIFLGNWVAAYRKFVAQHK